MSMAESRTKTMEAAAAAVGGKPPVCPVCESQAVVFLCEVDGFRIFRCPQSATDFVWPMPGDAQLKQLYDREQWFEGGEKGGYQNYDAQTEPLLPFYLEMLAECERESKNVSILDVGCGYGTHLAMASRRGWQCFGVEVSEHARKIARERHGERLYVVESVERVIPHQFDVILMLEVIEHLHDPYPLFYSLFSLGAIGPKTRIAITTPNARSFAAVSDPGAWIYRHPPSHLVYYSARSLRHVLERLRFTGVKVEGTYPADDGKPASYEDETAGVNDEWVSCSGLLARASGSDFMEFMHERYVPGTWSKITEYEHLPRYAFARTYAVGAQVLDFGCGTGYGAAQLAEVAEHVLGLDASADALVWARATHDHSHLSFEQRDDLGRGLPASSFDLITCFEMIEHVDEDTQREAVQSFARLLRPAAKLLISTPNPEVTVNYGENPYHRKELTEQEFRQLLSASFAHVQMLRQWIRPSVTLAADDLPGQAAEFGYIGGTDASTPPANFLAICSHQPLPGLGEKCYLDGSQDFVAVSMAREKALHQARIEHFSILQRTRDLYVSLVAREAELAENRAVLDGMKGSFSWKLTAPMRFVAQLLRGGRSRSRS